MIEQEILDCLRGYSKAFYEHDFERVIDYLYQEEVRSFRQNLEWTARAMLPFGETSSLLQIFGVQQLEDLQELSDKVFVARFFAGSMQILGTEQVSQLVKSIQIEQLDHVEYIANVDYSFVNVFMENRGRVNSSLRLIKSEGRWYVLFQPGMEESFDRYRRKIAAFDDAQSKDNTDYAYLDDEEFQVFKLYGYQTPNENVIIQPRFSEAGEFGNGLAPVKVFRKWGYIDKKGSWAITPQFSKAYSFSNQLALVGTMTEDIVFKYGYINTKGELVIDYKYDNAYSFTEGLAAVREDKKWGFINRRGETVIAFEFNDADPFEDGVARVELKGDILYIDHEGRIVEGWED